MRSAGLGWGPGFVLQCLSPFSSLHLHSGGVLKFRTSCMAGGRIEKKMSGLLRKMQKYDLTL